MLRWWIFSVWVGEHFLSGSLSMIMQAGQYSNVLEKWSFSGTQACLPRPGGRNRCPEGTSEGLLLLGETLAPKWIDLEGAAQRAGTWGFKRGSEECCEGEGMETESGMGKWGGNYPPGPHLSVFPSDCDVHLMLTSTVSSHFLCSFSHFFLLDQTLAEPSGSLGRSVSVQSIGGWG